jgi:hypothetical protein
MKTADDVQCSTFAIDLCWVSGKAPDPSLASHLAGCPQCRAYLTTLEALADDPLPWGLRAVERGARRRLSWAWAVGGLAAAACLAVVLVRPGGQTEGGYVGTKGTPSVELLVRRGAETSIWDGRSPVRAGDTLALRVACEGLGHVAVAAPRDGAQGWARVVDAACAADPSAPLPFTLVVDDRPGQEHFAVVLSRVPLDEARIRSAAEATTRTGDMWTVRFDLPKLGGAPR